MRLTETGRGSEGRISHEAIKANRPLPTVVNRESDIHVKFGLLTPSQFLSVFMSKKPVGLKIFALNYRTPKRWLYRTRSAKFFKDLMS